MSARYQDDSRLFLDFLREIKGSDASYRDEIWLIREREQDEHNGSVKAALSVFQVSQPVPRSANVHPIQVRKKGAARW